MPEKAELEGVFRGLVPVNRLALEAQQRLWKVTQLKSLAAGQLVFARGISDGLIHYLIDGEVDLLDHGRLVQRLHPRSRTARRPLDESGPKRYTARTYTPCTIACLTRAELERATESTRLPGSVQELAASGLAGCDNGDWMARIMDSDLFKVLPNDAIQQFFGAMETLDVHTDEAVLNQGDLGDYFYVVERGFFEVIRHAGATRQEVHVVDLRPGDTFGEAALISGYPRDASVVALTEGRVLRLPKAQFDALIAVPLLHPIGAKEAIANSREGTRWLDISDPEIYAKAPLRNSRNIPLNALRAQSERLNRNESYIVCSDDPAHSAVGAYILAERGFKTSYLQDSIVMLIADDASLALASSSERRNNVIVFPLPDSELVSPANPKVTAMETKPPPASNPDSTIERVDRLYTQQEFEAALATRVPKEAYADTHTGQSLAKLIEDIDARTETLDHDHADANIESTNTEFIDLGELEANALLARTAAPPPRPALDLELPGIPAAAAADPVADLVHDFERRLRNYVEANLLERTLEVERRYRDKVQRLQQNALSELRKRDAELKLRYAAHYKKKEQTLRDNYQKLMALAHKISQQKAQLQQARKQYEEKTKAAHAVYRQVEDMRRLLGEQMGTLDIAPGTRASNA